jgi:hypothetical protein
VGGWRGRLIWHYKRSVARARFSGAFADDALLCSAIVLQLIDAALLFVYLFHKVCVLVLQFANGIPFVPESREPLGATQHDCGVSSERDEAEEDENRT